MNESVPAASRRHGNEVIVCVSPAQDLNHDARLPCWCADDHGGSCHGKARLTACNEEHVIAAEAEQAVEFHGEAFPHPAAQPGLLHR
jgi:hypothetical protein